MHEGGTSSNNAEKEKNNRKKKKASQKETIHLNATSACVNVPNSHGEKTDEHQDRLDSTLAKIDKLANESRDHKKLLQTCDKREYEFNK